MAVNWNPYVNKKFYSHNGQYEENFEKVSFKSGREVFYKKNTLPRKEHSVKLWCDDKTLINGKTEFEWFLDWYENELESGTETVILDCFEGYQKEYRLDAAPSWRGQAKKEISLHFKEVL